MCYLCQALTSQSMTWSQFRMVTQSCLTLWPHDCSMLGLPVHHQLPEPTQTHVYHISNAIRPSLPLSSPSPPAFNLSQHQGLYKWVSFLHQEAVVGVLASASVLPMNIAFRIDWLDLLAVQGTLKSLLQHRSSKASILRRSASFTVQLSHPYMTRRTLVGKVMSLLLNMLSRLIITFLPRSKRLLISWLQSPSAVILEPKKIKSDTVSTVSLSISHEVMGLDAIIFVFWMLSFKPTFSLSSFTFIKRLFSSSSLSAIRVVSSAHVKLLIFLPAILIPACASSSPAFLMMYSAAAAAAAKSLQSCPTLCNPIDGSPPGSTVPGILQARTLEWVAISFSDAWKWKVKVKSLSRVQLSAAPWTAAYQAPPSMGFSRQEYWSGVPLPSPKKPLDESERGEWKSWLIKLNFTKTKIMVSGPITSWK